MTFELIPRFLLLAVLLYGIAGLIFAIAFTLRGASAIDPIIATTPLRTRVLFVPGAMALWPVLLVKWTKAGRRG